MKIRNYARKKFHYIGPLAKDYKIYEFVMYGFRSKLVCLVTATDNSKNTSLQQKLSIFNTLFYERLFLRVGSGLTRKHYTGYKGLLGS